MVATLTVTPSVCAHGAHCMAKVASGWVATWARSRSASAGPIAGQRPERDLGARLPVAARCWRHRWMVLVPTPKVRETSAWLRPASMAPSSRSRRSTHYGCMPSRITASQLMCNPL
jgi:hypothetical protein